MNPIFPSILNTDFFDLQEKLQDFQKLGIDFIHLDIMDGHFVETISFGPSFLAAIKKRFPFSFDVHLMADNPRHLVPQFAAAGARWISFHVETERDVPDLCKLIQENNSLAGLVINPETPIAALFPYLYQVDFILLMSVHPGRGGQEFIENTLDRCAILKREMQRQGFLRPIQVDGGVKAANISRLARAGADIFIVGTALYNAPDIISSGRELLALINGDTK